VCASTPYAELVSLPFQECAACGSDRKIKQAIKKTTAPKGVKKPDCADELTGVDIAENLHEVKVPDK
jgi:hypothetical protein